MGDTRLLCACNYCKANFSIAIEDIEDSIECPKCGEDSNVTARCQHCNKEFQTNGLGIGEYTECPFCGDDIVINTFKTVGGGWQVVSMTGRVEMHDLASALSVLQHEMQEEERASRRKVIPPAQGCFGMLLMGIGFSAGLWIGLSALACIFG